MTLTWQHWSEIDRRTPGLGDDAVTRPFSQERIDWYHERLEKAFDVMERTFPNSQIVWRRPHEPGCGRFDTPCMRVVQYGQVADYVVSKRPHIRVNQFAKLVRAFDAQKVSLTFGGGARSFFSDEIHPGLTFALLAGDVTLYELREAVLRRGS